MKPKVLLVDDDPVVLERTARLLTRRYDVVTAADAEHGLRACRARGPFAAVVTDYQMPGLAGDEFLHRLHAEWPDTVALLLTARVDVDVVVGALHRGEIFRFLRKPCPAETLWSALDAALERHAARRDERARARELESSCDSLEELAGSLEQRVRHQTRTLARLHRLAVELNSAESFDEIASLAARAAAHLSGRGVRVELVGAPGGPPVVAAAGPTLSRRWASLGLEARDAWLGSIAVDVAPDAGGELGEDLRAVLSTVGSATAVAARNEARRRERDAAQQGMILALAKLAESRDDETGKHLERVSRYCEILALELRARGLHLELITDAWVAEVSRCAPLHDIGKVGIPDAILRKPGGLSPEEWQVMQSHTEIGAATLRAVLAAHGGQSFLQTTLDIAWCHHERWDGTGYPRGLLGSRIPLSARLVALADVYDALTTERPYKHAWSHAEALEWIGARGGTHFDPDVVAAFRARAASFDRVRRELRDGADGPRAERAPRPAATVAAR